MKKHRRAGIKSVAFIVLLSCWSTTALADETEEEAEQAAETMPQSVEAPNGDEPIADEPGADEPSADALTVDAPDGTYDPGDDDISWRWVIGGQLFALTGGTIWYALDEETNAVDWDYSGLWGDAPDDLEMRPQSEAWRGLDGWRFDDNVMVLNTPLHPLAGSSYYILARSSSLGMLGSFLAQNATSMTWETVIEHQEVTSVNDLILTGVGGVPLGEMYYQMGEYFRRGERTRFNRVMSWIFGLPSQLRDVIHGRTPGHALTLDERGLPDDTWSRFVLHSGVGGEINAGPYGEIGVSGELSQLPDYRRAGDHDGWLTGPLKTSLAASLSADDNRVNNWKIDARLDLAGYYLNEIDGEAGEEEGTSLFVGTGMGFRHVQHWYEEEVLVDSDFLGRYGIVHLPGFRLEASWFGGEADIHFSYAALPDFTSIDSVAYPEYFADTGRIAPRTVLADERYYYGWGFSNLLRLEFDIAAAHVYGNLDLHWTRSIDRLDRFKHDTERFGEDLDGYLSLTDSVTHLEVGALFDMPIPNLRTGIIAEGRQRRGTVDDGNDQWNQQRRDVRVLGTVQMVY